MSKTLKALKTVNLKSCPFCGGRAHRRTIEVEDYQNTPYGIRKSGKVIKRRMIECRDRKCLIRPSTWLYVNTTEWEEAYEAWNTRVISV